MAQAAKPLETIPEIELVPGREGIFPPLAGEEESEDESEPDCAHPGR